jgi:hypothetical protein
MRKLAVVIAALLVALPIAALDFNLSPNADGSFDFSLKHEWSYGNGPFFSAASLTSCSASSTDKDSTSRSMGSERDFAAALAPLGLQFGSGPNTLRASLDLGWTRMSISELGYADVSRDFTDDAIANPIDYRFFLANDRVIDLALPKLRLDSKFWVGPFSASLGGEYSPWLFVKLDQTLSTSTTPAFPLDLPTDKHHVSTQSANSAFSLEGSVYFRNSFVEPGIEASYDYLSIKYGYLNAFGIASTMDSRAQTLKLSGSAIFRFMKVAGLSPKIGLVRAMEWNDDLSDDEGPVASGGDWKLSLGFAK